MEVLNQSPIESALATANLTEQAIQKLQEFMPLKINGIDDKDGYKAVKEARIICKNTRVLAEKICKKGREEAISIQKQWIAKEKEVVAKIAEVEDYLSSQQKTIDDAIEKERLKEIALKQLPHRRAKCDSIGLTTSDDELLAMDDARFFAFFSSEYDKQMAEKEAAIRAKAERIAKEKAQAEAEQKRLADIAAAEQRAKEKAERDAKEAIERAEREKAEAIARAEREKIEAAQRAEKEKQAAILAEQQKAKAEAERIEKERLAKIEAERLSKIEAERKAALAPDKDKLTELSNRILFFELPQCESEKARNIVLAVHRQLKELSAKVSSEIEKL